MAFVKSYTDEFFSWIQNKFSILRHNSRPQKNSPQTFEIKYMKTHEQIINRRLFRSRSAQFFLSSTKAMQLEYWQEKPTKLNQTYSQFWYRKTISTVALINLQIYEPYYEKCPTIFRKQCQCLHRYPGQQVSSFIHDDIRFRVRFNMMMLLQLWC